jgi:putative glutamine amidotransferase
MLQARPRIGLVPDVDLTRNRGVDYRRHLVYAELCDRLHEAGGLPLVLPYPPDDEVLEAQLRELDGVLLPGGDFDVDPRRYGQAPHPRLGTIKPDRTDFEIRLCQRARSDGIPLLGICAGLQVLNVARGGSLWQHLPEQRPSELSHVQAHNRKLPSHSVEVAAGTRLAALCGAGPLDVNSTHHQGIQELGRDLVAAAVATDGLIEAVEDPAHPFCVGVQWHPETLEQVAEAHRHRGVFAGLVDAARRRRTERTRGAPPADRP